jgi:hypothetical protein
MTEQAKSILPDAGYNNQQKSSPPRVSERRLKRVRGEAGVAGPKLTRGGSIYKLPLLKTNHACS